MSAVLFYLTPFILGYPITLNLPFIRRHHRSESYPIEIHRQINKLFMLFESFIFGSLIIYLSAILVNLAARSNNFSATYKELIIIEILISLTVGLVLTVSKRNELASVVKTLIKPLLIIFLISTVSYTVWRWQSSTHTTLNWDLYAHQLIVEKIALGEFDFYTSKLTDTFGFNAYPTFFHLLLATPQMLLKPDVLKFWWYLEFLHLASTVLASYLIGLVITKSRWVGLLASLIGGLTFESFMAYTGYFLIPQNLTATIAAVFISYIIFRFANSNSLIVLRTVPMAIYLILNHYVIGIAGVIASLFSMFYLKPIRDLKMEKAIITASLLLLLLLPIGASSINLDFLNRGEAKHFNFSPLEKFGFMKDFFGYFMAIFVPIGAIYALRKRISEYNILNVLAISLLAVVISPIPYSIKFYSLARFFINTLAALGLWTLIKDLTIVNKIMSYLLVSLTLILILTVNVHIFKQTPSYGEIYSHVSPSEIDAASFLKDQYNSKNVMLISEPATMFVLEGLSGVNSPGGAYTSEATRRTLSRIYLIRNSETLGRDLFEIKDSISTDKPDKILFAISGRLSEWELSDEERRLGIYWNVWTPRDITLREEALVTFLKQYSGFKEVFRNHGVVILELERPI
ncbi:hypothetical protein A2716_01685 [candidate division WWE3 bacterium RIFCSPHIGHO2_01_FULL_40_23]|nr:MAG: hypothetical protein A2716_01685 [candidate division WWE3 bacterium RIFCSPHIGHO2_01_FULL_40_23]